MTDRKNKRLLKIEGDNIFKFHQFAFKPEPPYEPKAYQKTLFYPLDRQRHTEPRILNYQINEMHNLKVPNSLTIEQTILNMDSRQFIINEQAQIDEQDRKLIDEEISVDLDEYDNKQQKSAFDQVLEKKKIDFQKQQKEGKNNKQEDKTDYKKLNFSTLKQMIEENIETNQFFNEKNAKQIKHPTKPGVYAKKIIPINPLINKDNITYTVVNQKAQYLSQPNQGYIQIFKKQDINHDKLVVSYQEINDQEFKLQRLIRQKNLNKPNKQQQKSSKLKKKDDGDQSESDISQDIGEENPTQKEKENEKQDQVVEEDNQEDSELNLFQPETLENQLNEAVQELDLIQKDINKIKYDQNIEKQIQELQNYENINDYEEIFKDADERLQKTVQSIYKVKQAFEIGDDEDENKNQTKLLLDKQQFQYKEINHKHNEDKDILLLYNKQKKIYEFVHLDSLIILDKEIKKQVERIEFVDYLVQKQQYIKLQITDTLEKALLIEKENQKIKQQIFNALSYQPQNQPENVNRKDKIKKNPQKNMLKKSHKKSNESSDMEDNESEIMEQDKKVDIYDEEELEEENNADDIDKKTDDDEEEIDTEEDDSEDLKSFLASEESDDRHKKHKKDKKSKKHKKHKKHNKHKKHKKHKKNSDSEDEDNDDQDEEENQDQVDSIENEQESRSSQVRKKQKEKMKKSKISDNEEEDDEEEEDENDNSNKEQVYAYNAEDKNEDDEEEAQF